MTDGASFQANRRDVLGITAGAVVMPYFAASQPAMAALPATGLLGVGRDQPLDDGWLFRRGAGEGLEAVGLNDGDWRRVDLPHDWSIEDVPGGATPDHIGPFDRKAVGGTATGFTNGGEGWYRKHLNLAGVPADARVEIVFDGVYEQCDVWLNGEPVGSHLHGYAPFAVDLTPKVARGGENVLAVRVRNIGQNSRWYSGSGIYRQVRVDVLPAGARLARWGVGAWTRRIEGGSAEVQVTTRVEAPDPALTLVTRLRDAKGRIVAEASSPGAAEVVQTLAVRGAHLWSQEDPHLHRLETELRRHETVVDRQAQDFGLRIVTIDARQGLAINGKRTMLRGGCIHHDNGLLGACAYADADERKVRLLQARGFNAIRSSHNPASRTLRAACDKLGMLLIDEAFDMWHLGKNPDDYARHFRQDWEVPLTAMVLSARNSPSVIMWSIGNEIPDRSTPEGIEWSWKLANTVRRLDPSRPVTAALHGTLGPLIKVSDATARPGRGGEIDNAAAAFLDVAGYNYRIDQVEGDHAAHPDRVAYGSETYARDAWGYDRLMRTKPYFIGEFLWTAMDYLGEAGLGVAEPIKAGGPPFYLPTWPWVNAWCGDIDLIGDQKAPSRFRDVLWDVSKLEMAVLRPVPEGKVAYVSAWGWRDELQSWTWPGSEGKPMAVRVYTRGDRVELRLNGAKVGERMLAPESKAIAEFAVPYAPGVIEAVAFVGGREIARKRLDTVGAAAKLRLRPERLSIGGGRQDLAYVAIDVLDAVGRVLPDDKRRIELSIEGPAELAGFGSANPLAVGSFQASSAQSFRGRALAILRGTGRKGVVKVTVRSAGLAGGAVRLPFG